MHSNITTFYDDISARDNRDNRVIRSGRYTTRKTFTIFVPYFISRQLRNISVCTQYVIYRFISTPRVGNSGTAALS